MNKSITADSIRVQRSAVEAVSSRVRGNTKNRAPYLGLLTMTGTAHTPAGGGSLPAHLNCPRYAAHGAAHTAHQDSTSPSSAADDFASGTCSSRRSKR